MAPGRSAMADPVRQAVLVVPDGRSSRGWGSEGRIAAGSAGGGIDEREWCPAAGRATAAREPGDPRKVRVGRTSSDARAFARCGGERVTTEPVQLTGDC